MAPSDEEEDYMTMTFEETPKQKFETSLQRAARKRREGEERSRQKTKAEREAEEEAMREAALSTALSSTNKGFQMMAKFGFKQGDALGKSENARKVPVQITMKDDKGGIGLESEKKRKLREHAEEFERQTKRSKEEALDFREHQRQQIKEKQYERDFHNAQRIAERLFEKENENETSEDAPLKSVNVLWRGLKKYRLEDQHKKKEEQALKDSLLGRLPTYVEDDDNDTDYKIALGGDTNVAFIEDELDDDSELEEFQALPFADQLDKIILFLRENHSYCYWCGHQYPDATMEGCPGVTEGEHD